MESWLLAQYAEIEATKAEIEAMKALNSEREQRNESIAYTEDAFLEKAGYLHAITDIITKHR